MVKGHLLVNSLRIDGHLGAAVLYLWPLLTSILLPTFIRQPFVKSIAIVVEVDYFVAKAVNQCQHHYGVLIRHVHVVAD